MGLGYMGVAEGFVCCQNGVGLVLGARPGLEYLLASMYRSTARVVGLASAKGLQYAN